MSRPKVGEFLNNIQKVQDEMNALLMKAYQLNLRVEIDVSDVACHGPRDHRKCLGITIYDETPIYQRDGVP